MRRTPWPLGALAMLALIVAGCSNAPSSTVTNGGNSSASIHEKAVKFAECMRDNGVSEFPDPDASGQFTYGIKAGSPLDPSTAAWQKAIGACADLEPPGALGGGTRTDQQMASALEFAQCMRQNGVKDFPDPTSTGPLINVQHAQSIPGFQAAVDKCRALLAAAAGGQ